MRNLCMWEACCKREFHHLPDKSIVCFGHHEESKLGDFFIISNTLVVSNVGADQEFRWKKDISEVVTPNNNPVNITFLSLINTVSVGLTNGELITITNNGCDCDVVGICDNGLLAMEWSPDQELLALVTNDLHIVLMSCTFDLINEKSLLDEDFGDKQFITVGWGKKETQFHGSAGKQAAKTKIDVLADNNSEVSDRIIISWRGDGNLFAVGFLMDGIRRFKVFDREGNLQYTSEKQQGLEANLSWRPSGNLIATTQKVDDKHLIAFFEKNGLKHGEFVLPIDSQMTVKDILWSSDSEILTVVCYNLSENIYKVLLFTTGNYHWYLKQTLVFEENITKILWDNDFDVSKNKKIHILLQNGDYLSYTWIWSVDHSKGKSERDDAVVAVIDGTKILITDFRHIAVPPPLSNFEIDVGAEISSIHFAPENCNNIDSNSFIAVTDKNVLILEQTNKKPLKYTISNTIPLCKNYCPFQCFNWHWLNENILLCIKVDIYNYYELIYYEILKEKVEQLFSQSLPTAALRIYSHPLDIGAVFLQLDTGAIIEYNKKIIPHKITFPQICPKFGVLSVDNELYFLGLSHKGYFYLNSEMVLNNVNSYFVHTSYLLLTTLKHMLYCVELNKDTFTSISTYEKMESADIYKRKIERGAKLIISVPKGTITVLQIPRGNLETIQPRPLSLKIIGEYLNTRKYYEAFDFMRKQRINLNLIYDHNPNEFEENINVILDSIQNNSWLSLFLSDLENTDVTKTMYSSSYIDHHNMPEDKIQNKVEFICDLVRLHLNNASNRTSRVLPLLTTFVKKNKVIDLEQALKVIKELKNQELAGSKLPVTSDEALKYLLYMVNVDQLFDVALGMYDFDLVLLVANKSQKDPKEYIPMLNELNEMDDDYRKFTINKHLKRFDRAVKCLANCGEKRYTELRSFVKYHSLYREALALFPLEDDIYQQIADDFGLYLKLKKQYIEAGIMYERAKNIEKAIECYKEALEWELVLKLSQNKSKDELKTLALDLANGLKEEKRFKEAIALLEQYSDDTEDIINFATNNALYKTAMRLCAKYNKLNLIGKIVLPSVLEEYESLKDLIQTNGQNFTKYRDRLLILNKAKTLKKATEDFETPYGYNDSDLYSDAGSTIASSGSGRSYRSSKNRRKHERKVASLKEGSQFEDTALVMALHSLVTSSFELRLQVKEINVALSSLNKDKEALSLQMSLEKLLKEMKDSFKQIWSNDFTLEATSAAIAAENFPEGSAIILQGIATLGPHLRIAPIIPELNWKLEGLNS